MNGSRVAFQELRSLVHNRLVEESVSPIAAVTVQLAQGRKVCSHQSVTVDVCNVRSRKYELKSYKEMNKSPKINQTCSLEHIEWSSDNMTNVKQIKHTRRLVTTPLVT
jgi:hypothetical protein